MSEQKIPEDLSKVRDDIALELLAKIQRESPMMLIGTTLSGAIVHAAKEAFNAAVPLVEQREREKFEQDVRNLKNIAHNTEAERFNFETEYYALKSHYDRLKAAADKMVAAMKNARIDIQESASDTVWTHDCVSMTCCERLEHSEDEYRATIAELEKE